LSRAVPDPGWLVYNILPIKQSMCPFTKAHEAMLSLPFPITLAFSFSHILDLSLLYNRDTHFNNRQVQCWFLSGLQRFIDRIPRSLIFQVSELRYPDLLNFITITIMDVTFIFIISDHFNSFLTWTFEPLKKLNL